MSYHTQIYRYIDKKEWKSLESYLSKDHGFQPIERLEACFLSDLPNGQDEAENQI